MSFERDAKRLVDVTGAIIMIALLAPLFAILAIAIKTESHGPVFFRQNRLGYRGAIFSIFKFRTMTHGAVLIGAGAATYDGDPRVTRVGALLRKYRLDELPQLFNVLMGQMSLVGPRPLLPEYLDDYSPRDRRRLLMPPGMTGWQQVNGGATDNWAERVEADVWYVENWSLRLDLAILLRTPLVVLRADTVYGKDGWQRSGIPQRDQQIQEEAA